MEVEITGIEQRSVPGTATRWVGIGHVQRQGYRLKAVVPLSDDEAMNKVLGAIEGGTPYKKPVMNLASLAALHLEQ